MDCYDEHDDYLARRWQVTEPDRLKTYFFLNLVSHGWAFGNQHHPDRPASIFSNEENGWRQPRPGPATIRDYLDANIACCNDYAYLLKFLLDREGIRNRLAAIPGHIFNEVYLDGGWHVVDATTNMVFDASWHSIQNEPSCQRGWHRSGSVSPSRYASWQALPLDDGPFSEFYALFGCPAPAPGTDPTSGVARVVLSGSRKPLAGRTTTARQAAVRRMTTSVLLVVYLAAFLW
ncbi:MAG: hypothetical protein KatS3mg105_0092 [Gemmatales bacterium]|nr:MAG: hypothetical protein KatS3mg105_0092 [Gemmatales bacterium]